MTDRTRTERDEMEAALEAILFVSSEPVPRPKLLELFDEDEREAAAEALEAVLARYSGEGRGVLVEDVAGGVRLATRPEVVGWLRRFFDVAGSNKLSMAALETLAIIAYRQPMTSPEIQELRGVSAAGVLKTLLERRLVRIVGRKEVVGKPFLYGTTREFLVHFGLNSLKDLPPLEEFEETFGSGDASAVAGLAEMAGLPPRMDEPESRGEDREERILREIADLEERQDDLEERQEEGETP
jgi:segregation and condensation protein B